VSNDRLALGDLEVRVLAGRAADADTMRARIDHERDQALECRKIETPVIANRRRNRGE